MNRVYVDGGVVTRHPEQKIEKADAVTAWNNAIRSRPGLEKNPAEYLAIGIDDKGRLMEPIAIRNDNEDFLIYAAPAQRQKRARLSRKER